MIKAVFFDLYNTLVSYDPPREELQARALKEFGIEVSPEVFRRPLAIADEFIYQELVRSSLTRRSKEEQMAVWAKYEEILLREAGIKADEQLIFKLLGNMHKMDYKLVLFDDVMPTLNELKDRKLTLGLISNVDRNITSLLDKLGVKTLLQVVVTSQDAGANKPQPAIFRKALRQAGTQASEAIYVGDQYQVDVVGASKVGMKGILLDRNGYFEETTDCPRLRSLAQLVEHL